jgi:CMP-N,N'-diacetyllegionaminic acid synthase
MIGSHRVLAVVPARGGSKGLVRKNVLPFAGKPLIGWSIEQASASMLVDAVVVSTDDEEIAEVARRFGAEVPFMRPAELATDTASSIDVLLHAIGAMESKGVQSSIVMLVEPTSPLRETVDIDGALRRLVEMPEAESVVGVAAVEAIHPAYLMRERDGFLHPYLGKAATGILRQELEPLLYLEGSVYAAYVDSLRRRRSFYHERTIGWPVARYKALEIDEMCDLIAGEALILARQEGRLS